MTTSQQWFKDAKYGLFIHFGLYSLLAGEYQGKQTDRIAEWIMNDLNIPVNEYEKLIEEFNPVHFDTDYIASKAKSWGMKYIVFTSKHHEGFANFNSYCSSYNSMNACNRDLVKELKDSCDKYGLKMGLYYSQAQDWHDPNGYMKRKENGHKDYQYYLDHKCMPQLKEIMEQYHPDLIWFDTPMETTFEQSKKMVELVKSYNPDVVISGRIGNGLGEYMTTGDNFIPRLPFEDDWEVPATLNDTWGYNRFDKNWKDPYEIIKLLIKINARGGNYLLNIGPMGDGSIPKKSIEILDTVGKYVAENKDAIYATKKYGIYPYELDYAEFTCKDHHLYIHVFKSKRRIEILNIDNQFTSAKTLKDGTELVFRVGHTCEGHSSLEIDLPEDYQDQSYYVIDVTFPEDKLILHPIEL